MDFRQANPAPVNRSEAGPSAPAPTNGIKKVKPFNNAPKWLNWLSVVILFGVTVLLALTAFSIARVDTKNGEEQYVKTG